MVAVTQVQWRIRTKSNGEQELLHLQLFHKLCQNCDCDKVVTKITESRSCHISNCFINSLSCEIKFDQLPRCNDISLQFVKKTIQISVHSICRIVTLSFHKTGNTQRSLFSFDILDLQQHSITVVKFPFVQHQLFWSAKFTKIRLTVSLICTIYVHGPCHAVGFDCSYFWTICSYPFNWIWLFLLVGPSPNFLSYLLLQHCHSTKKLACESQQTLLTF